MATTTVELETVATLCESWQEIAPTLAEVSRRTGLSRPEALLLYTCSLLASMGEDDSPEPWATA